MDESLQLLPAVETLDLSRNKFTKVDNLRKCKKLKHLDLGFNQLRTIAPLSEVCSENKNDLEYCGDSYIHMVVSDDNLLPFVLHVCMVAMECYDCPTPT